jgi:hypothetical protein
MVVIALPVSQELTILIGRCDDTIQGGNTMKKIMLIGVMIVLAVMLGVAALHAQTTGQSGTPPAAGGSQPGYGPQGQQGWYCPGWGAWQGGGAGPGMMGSGMMGPGMMGRGMGPGMMQQGGGMGPGMMGQGYGPGPQQYQQQPQKPLEKTDAEAMVQNYLNATRNPNLKLGKLREEGSAFEADIMTKNGSLVDKLLIDKNTGWMRSAY